MNSNEQAEFDVLKLATEEGVFAIELRTPMPTGQQQLALNRLQKRRWITLIDVSPIAIQQDKLFRVFMATEEAMTWFRSQRQ